MLAAVVGISSGSIQRPWLLRGHVMVLPFGWMIVHPVFSKVTVQPWSHRGATASNKVWMLGNMCARVAWLGTPLIGSSAVCMDVMYCWFTTWACIGWLVGVTR